MFLSPQPRRRSGLKSFQPAVSASGCLPPLLPCSLNRFSGRPGVEPGFILTPRSYQRLGSVLNSASDTPGLITASPLGTSDAHNRPILTTASTPPP